MGLFRKKQKDFIDLGDQIAISPEKAEEMAQSILSSHLVDMYEDPLGGEISSAMQEVVVRRWAAVTNAAGSTLASVARFGYVTRRYEETLDSIPSQVASIGDDLSARLAAGESVGSACADLAIQLSAHDPKDPAAPRSLDAIPGLGDMRDAIAQRTLIVMVSIAAENEWLENGELPSSLQARDLLEAWRLGFLVRCCESALPEGTTLGEPSKTVIAVDVTAAQAAFESWFDEQESLPEEEAREAMNTFLTDPRFRLDPDSEPTDDEARYVLFEVDDAGRIQSPQEKNQA